MPWIAIHEGEKKAPRQVPKHTDVTCPTCGGRMRVWSRATDGKARHFKHIANMGHSEGGGSGGAACESVAESDKHKKWKSIAADRLEQVFDDVAECNLEVELAAPGSDQQKRVADVLLTFETRDNQLGAGIAVEVQHKNESKNIEATTTDYIAQDYAVVWLTGDDFGADRLRMNEVDIRSRARQAVWPDWQPTVDRSTSGLERGSSEYIEQDLWPLVSGPETLTIRLPPEWYDQVAQHLWTTRPWGDLFNPSPVPKYTVQGLAHPQPRRRSIPAHLSESIIDTERYNRSWDELFDDPDPVPQTNSWEYKTKIPFNLFFHRKRWRAWWRSGRFNETEGDPERPSNPYNDVQCRNCGTFWHHSKEYETCPECGAAIEWEWNIETGRIDREVAPSYT